MRRPKRLDKKQDADCDSTANANENALQPHMVPAYEDRFVYHKPKRVFIPRPGVNPLRTKAQLCASPTQR